MIGKRRQEREAAKRAEAVIKMLMAAEMIANEQGLCMTCLLLALGHVTSDKVRSGEFGHQESRHIGPAQRVN